MKNQLVVQIGKFLMKYGNLRICIIDDQKTYFSENMLRIAKAAGFSNIKRYFLVDKELMQQLLRNPPDIVILDIKGVADTAVAKDGFSVAKTLYDNTETFIVITSAHKFFLHESHKSYDYMIKERLLTALDFVDELSIIVDQYLKVKIRFYKKIIFKIGFSMLRKTITNGASA